MNPTRSRWLARAALVAIMLALLAYGRLTPGGRSGDWVVWALVALGAAAAVFLVWRSRWRDGP